MCIFGRWVLVVCRKVRSERQCLAAVTAVCVCRFGAVLDACNAALSVPVFGVKCVQVVEWFRCVDATAGCCGCFHRTGVFTSNSAMVWNRLPLGVLMSFTAVC